MHTEDNGRVYESLSGSATNNQRTLRLIVNLGSWPRPRALAGSRQTNKERHCKRRLTIVNANPVVVSLKSQLENVHRQTSSVIDRERLNYMKKFSRGMADNLATCLLLFQYLEIIYYYYY